jgi:hypothetical protein
MNIAELIPRPITTPEYPDPAEAGRFIHDERGVYGRDYVFLEDATWHALCHIATLERRTVSQLCDDIHLGSGGPPFAPAARYCVLCYVAERLPAAWGCLESFFFSRCWGSGSACNDQRQR